MYKAMMLIRNDSGLVVGRDLVDCVIGTMRSHGEVTVRGSKEFTIAWKATVGIVEAERAIRASVKQDYKRVTRFISRPCAPPQQAPYPEFCPTPLHCAGLMSCHSEPHCCD